MNSNLLEMIKKDFEEVAQIYVSDLEMLKNERIFITGGTGFVGTWIAEIIAFLNDNFNFNTTLILVSRNAENFKQMVPHIALRKDITLVSRDVRSLLEIPGDVAYIIHAAATPDNRQHVSDPISIMDTITKGTASIIDSAFKLPKLKKILNISSGQIYGKQPMEIEAVSESFMGAIDCNTITSAYPEAKRYAEAICCAYWSLYKIPIVTARPFSFIGPYQSLNKPWAVNNFIRDVLMNYTVRIIGNGEAIRSYMYPSDMAIWFLRILLDGKPGLVYNVGSPHGISLKQLAEKIIDYSNAKSKIVIQYMNDDKSKFIPDVKLCRDSLGLGIKVDTDETLKRSIMWFKEYSKESLT
ncbi:MAG: NAD-dependent epimerase/dehydratase family protein [Acetobacterium woodii]|nr:NAD-dependent epimerase/dehydratase family protein [Acetobacterium woodii]MBI5677832.1 NAD-dependent epimerase/dehydratase family protein [Planctomycetota bacterium]